MVAMVAPVVQRARLEVLQTVLQLLVAQVQLVVLVAQFLSAVWWVEMV
jgi:hypothetical protein